MLALTCQRARLADGERILELGCGWGSLSLWMAENYPRARITAVSNSRTQKHFIDARAAERGLKNLEIVTCDVNRLFDRSRPAIPSSIASSRSRCSSTCAISKPCWRVSLRG